MDFVPFLPFMAVSFPESFVLYYMGITIFGYKSSAGRLAAAALFTSVVSYFVRSMPIFFGVHTIIQLILMIIIFVLVFKIPVLLSIITTFLSAFLLGLTEGLLMPLFGFVFGLTIKQILSDPLNRFLFGMPYFTIIALVTYFVSRKGWHITSLKRAAVEPTVGRSGQVRKLYMFIISILQALMLVFLNLNFYIYKAEVFPTFELSHLIISTSVVIIASSVTTVFVANRLIRIINREAQIEADLRHIREMQNLNLKIRSQRHDFYNHITSLYGFVRGGHFDEAKQYMESLYEDIKKVKDLLEIEPPALGALLSLKREKAGKLGVDFSWQIELGQEALPLSIQELTQVLGNLLDNGIEAAHSADLKTVKLKLDWSPLGLVIKVENGSSPVSREMLVNIFKPGYSTKDKGEHSGLGLFIVKEIVDRYNGEIEINEAESFSGLEIMVFIPQRNIP